MRHVLVLTMALTMGLAANAETRKKSSKSKSTVKQQTIVKETQQRPFRIVPSLGMAYMDLMALNDGRPDQGVIASAAIEIPKGDYAFQAGLGYLQAGTRFSEDNVKYTLMFDYLMVNAAAKSYFGNRRGFLVGGISPMLNLHSTYEAKSNGRTVRGHVNNIRDMDIVAKAGLGFEIPTKNSNVRYGGEATYNRGLLDARTAQGAFFNEGFLFTGFLSL
ncbi:MAG: outer membrane beta-barrel protein [Bdellovibrionales bacterium]